MPYAFVTRFDQFEAVCAEFEIPLPRVPGLPMYEDRALYYIELNAALQEFRRQHEMTPAQFNAFLYGFARDLVPEDEAGDLPPAARVWLLLANPEGDFTELDEADAETRFNWQGSYEMRPGDVAIMWCRSPRSAVHSIWRVTTRGFADPFFYYYRTVWIGLPIQVPPIAFRELQSNPIWAAKPAVRAHLQNSSGKEITADEYDALLRLLKARGCDTRVLPKLDRRRIVVPEGIESERDVEEKLLEPVLRRLGYRNEHWVRQLPLRMGRGDRVYPDYAFGVGGARGEECARMIIEAMLRLGTDRSRREAYLQARSYGERLAVRAFALCALDGIWTFTRDSGTFALDRCEKWNWSELSTASELRRLADAIGPERILARRRRTQEGD